MEGICIKIRKSILHWVSLMQIVSYSALSFSFSLCKNSANMQKMLCRLFLTFHSFDLFQQHLDLSEHSGNAFRKMRFHFLLILISLPQETSQSSL